VEDKLIYPNPKKQAEFDVVMERLLKDEKYLHFAYALTELTPGQYRATYNLVTYRPTEEELRQQRERQASNGKYAAKFF